MWWRRRDKVERWIAKLKDWNQDVRMEAAEALGKIGEPAVEPLIKALAYDFGDVRDEAAKALGKIGKPAIKPLIRVLGDSVVVVAAAEALGKIGKPAVEPLIRALGDKDSDVRSGAAEALRMIGDPRAVEPLIKAPGDENMYVRREVLEALRMIGDPRAVEPLIKALGDKDWDVRDKAAKALGNIGDSKAVEPLIKALRDEEYYVREWTAYALGKIGKPDAVGPLIKALADDFECVRKEAAWALGEIGKPAVEPLIEALGDEDSDVRQGAAKALNRIGWRPSLDSEISYYFIAKRDWEFLVSLGSIAVEPLIKALGDKYTIVREKAAETLGNIGDASAVEPLIQALRDTKYSVRMMAAEALGNIGDSKAIEPLIKALRDEEYYVRERTAYALGKIGKPAVEPLVKTLEDASCFVRMRAAEILEKIGWRPSLDREKSYYFIAKTDWESVVLLGSIAVEPLIKALGDKDSIVREKAAEALERICVQITTVVFGKVSTDDERTTLKNPDVSELTMPMKNLIKILVDTESYDFRQVERFLTYAVNYIGEKRLKKYVEVHINGDPDKLHPNLQNLFNNLCKNVEMHNVASRNQSAHETHERTQKKDYSN
ncbi:MAG: heat repeat-containing PBS lyase [Candidatus Scalindua rubra]|uniref:Heat repeat-containing PBS lyase n=1 Tax=Candidatus Scalindua rubra TaxID=1872076 RepID=A0A1E3XIH6_9BACT|nr:MAG: heat repeat-containing PBS lyase [Candidatus Scalindua rubra]